jgi:hypothetical protein
MTELWRPPMLRIACLLAVLTPAVPCGAALAAQMGAPQPDAVKRASARPAISPPAAVAPGVPGIDTRPVPFLPPAGQQAYLRYLTSNLPRAIAISPGGGYGFYGGIGTLEAARDKAVQSCTDKGGTGCAIYAENLQTVWPTARIEMPPPPPSAPLISGTGYNFTADNRYVWSGPARARGVYVWAHGYGGSTVDARGMQPQAHVRTFNNVGFDVVRFDRDPIYDGDRDRMAANLEAGLQALRRQGYRMVIAGGQSRGAWNSLQTLSTPGVADVVIAVSPAAHGTDAGNMVLRQETDLWQLMHDAHAPETRVAIVQFDQDPYSAKPERRVALVESQLRPRVGPVLVIDRPSGLTGHGAGANVAFAQGYADCLLHFALDTTPRSACATP